MKRAPAHARQHSVAQARRLTCAERARCPYLDGCGGWGGVAENFPSEWWLGEIYRIGLVSAAQRRNFSILGPREATPALLGGHPGGRVRLAKRQNFAPAARLVRLELSFC